MYTSLESHLLAVSDALDVHMVLEYAHGTADDEHEGIDDGIRRR